MTSRRVSPRTPASARIFAHTPAQARQRPALRGTGHPGVWHVDVTPWYLTTLGQMIVLFGMWQGWRGTLRHGPRTLALNSIECASWGVISIFWSHHGPTSNQPHAHLRTNHGPTSSATMVHLRTGPRCLKVSAVPPPARPPSKRCGRSLRGQRAATCQCEC